MASVPAGHVYVRHLDPMDGPDTVRRLADPPVAGRSVASQWWPPAMLSASWIVDHADEFDLFHLQFGFDALAPATLQDIVSVLRRLGKPLVYTVHDLRNPHHELPAEHDAHLDILIPAADGLITLTPGAARTIRDRWGRTPAVLPHPHVVPLHDIRPRSANRDGEFVVGVHAKSVRASMAPLGVLAALEPLAAELPHLRLQVNVHHDVHDANGRRHDADLVDWLDAHRDTVTVRVHDYFSDAELWSYLTGLDVSVLPYRFGTHSGWLEACHDLGTTVVAPDCGFYAEQRRCLTYHHDEDGLDAGSLRDAVRYAYDRRPVWQAEVAARTAERASIARSHEALYRQLLS